MRPIETFEPGINGEMLICNGINRIGRLTNGVTTLKNIFGKTALLTTTAALAMLGSAAHAFELGADTKRGVTFQFDNLIFGVKDNYVNGGMAIIQQPLSAENNLSWFVEGGVGYNWNSEAIDVHAPVGLRWEPVKNLDVDLFATPEVKFRDGADLGVGVDLGVSWTF
jgi:hypothetical protein